MSETLTRNQHSFSFISRSRTFRSIRCYRVQQQGRCNFVNPISFSPTLLPARNLLPYLNNLLIKGIQLSITREKEVMEIIRIICWIEDFERMEKSFSFSIREIVHIRWRVRRIWYRVSWRTMHTRDCTIFFRWCDKKWDCGTRISNGESIVWEDLFSLFFNSCQMRRVSNKKLEDIVSLLNLSKDGNDRGRKRKATNR